MRYFGMGTIRERRFFSTRGKTLWRFAAREGERRRVVAVQIFAKPRSKQSALHWSAGFLDCLIKPGLGIRPPAHGGRFGNAQHLARFFEAKASEIPQLH